MKPSLRAMRTVVRYHDSTSTGPPPWQKVLRIQPVNGFSNDSIQPIFTKRAMAPPSTLSQAIKTPHAIYVSGQIPASKNGVLIKGNITVQTNACIRSLSAILEEAGSSLDKVVKTTVFLTDIKDFKAMNEEYGRWFDSRPARSCVAVKELAMGATIEIECVALP